MVVGISFFGDYDVVGYLYSFGKMSYGRQVEFFSLMFVVDYFVLYQGFVFGVSSDWMVDCGG